MIPKSPHDIIITSAEVIADQQAKLNLMWQCGKLCELKAYAFFRTAVLPAPHFHVIPLRQTRYGSQDMSGLFRTLDVRLTNFTLTLLLNSDRHPRWGAPIHYPTARAPVVHKHASSLNTILCKQTNKQSQKEYCMIKYIVTYRKYTLKTYACQHANVVLCSVYCRMSV